MFFNRLGEIRDRSFEQRRYRASGLNLLTAAIVLWNTVYMSAVLDQLRSEGHDVDDGDVVHLSPARYAHINAFEAIGWRVDT